MCARVQTLARDQTQLSKKLECLVWAADSISQEAETRTLFMNPGQSGQPGREHLLSVHVVLLAGKLT